jgi:hypothetical protein
MVGMYTPRTRVLRVLLRLLDQPSLFAAESVQRTIARYAETVPGAMERGRVREAVKVTSAARAELEVLEPLDLTERRAAATRLAALAPMFQLWGKPAVLTTSTHYPRRSAKCRSRKATEPRVEQMSVPKASGREGKDAI